MGQVYSTYINHKVKNEKLLVKFTNEFIKNSGYECFKDLTLTTPKECIQVMIAADCQPDDYIERNKDGGFVEYYNCFKATYSWEELLWNWFVKISPTLEDGSDLEIDTDNGRWRLKVINGVAKEVEID
jgi:hypothetical protein